MIVENRISFLRLFQIIWWELLRILLIATTTVTTLIYFRLDEYAINQTIPVVFGTAIAIFLGFRTNSAYERWWEARKIWGVIVSDSRNMVRLCVDCFDSLANTQTELATDLTKEICYRQIAWTQMLDRHLKDLPLTGFEHLLTEQDLAAVKNANDPALVLLAAQGQSIRRALRHNLLDVRQSIMFEETLTRLYDQYGGCQRIKNTIFPVHYTYFTRVFIWIFLVLLGLSLPFHELHKNVNYSLIPAIFLIGWVFFMVEGIGNYMQNPFVNNRNVIPMEAMSRMIEINLREMIGETDLPEPTQPVDGALF